MPTPVRCFVCECMGGVRSLSWRRIEILSYANVKENTPFVTAVSCYCVRSNHTCLICLCFRGHISSYVNTCINRQTAWVIILEVHWTLASLFHTNPRFTSLKKKTNKQKNHASKFCNTSGSTDVSVSVYVKVFKWDQKKWSVSKREPVLWPFSSKCGKKKRYNTQQRDCKFTFQSVCTAMVTTQEHRHYFATLPTNKTMHHKRFHWLDVFSYRVRFELTSVALHTVSR